jgi:MOSC domain-containing protein YiiM
MVRRLKVDGDGKRDLEEHGGVNRAVFVYQIASCRYASARDPDLANNGLRLGSGAGPAFVLARARWRVS